MTTKVSDVVRDALLHLRVIDARQPVKAVDMADGIRALNLMMTAWEADGWSSGWSNVSNPSEDLPAPPELEELIGFALAIRLQARFRVTLDATIVAMAQRGEASLAAQVASQTVEVQTTPDLPVGVGRSGSWQDGFTG